MFNWIKSRRWDKKWRKGWQGRADEAFSRINTKLEYVTDYAHALYTALEQKKEYVIVKTKESALEMRKIGYKSVEYPKVCSASWLPTIEGTGPFLMIKEEKKEEKNV